jgi:hypothetical protein
MKSKLTISTDGINEEVFDDLECFGDDKQIEKYAKSALSSIAKSSLKLQIESPKESVNILYDNYKNAEPKGYYGSYSAEEIKELNLYYIKRLQKSIEEDSGKYYIDDIINLVSNAKGNVKEEHILHYNLLKNIILENCQMADPSVL